LVVRDTEGSSRMPPCCWHPSRVDNGPGGFACRRLVSRVSSIPNMRKSMALAQNRLIAAAAGRLRSKVGVRFTRFVIVAAAALTATEVALTVCNGVFHMTAVPAALVSWFVGAVVSYVLSRWAWERKGKPEWLRGSLP